MMTIVIMIMIASHAGDDDRPHKHDCVVTRGERYYRSYIVSRTIALFGKYCISVILRQYCDILFDIFDQIALSLWSLEETKLNRQF